jgi:hypothetical protein
MSWSTGSYSFDIAQGEFINGYLYVPNYYGNTITQTDLDGNIVNLAWCNGLTQAQCCIKYGDYLYVSTQNTISQVLFSDPTVVNTTWATGMSAAYGLAMYGTDLYVANYGNGHIAKISLVGGPTDTAWVTGFPAPLCVAVYGTNLYLASLAGNIYQISLLDKSTTVWASGVISTPAGLSVYGTNLYVSSLGGGTVTQISLLDKSTTTWTSGYARPFGLVAYNNNLYVSDNRNKIYKVALPALPLVCFKEDSKILTDKGYIPIQDLRKGDLVKTVKHGFKPIDMIGKRDIVHHVSEERIKDQLYKCSQSEYPDIFEPLVITGCHSILVDEFVSEDQRDKSIEVLGDIFVTDKKYRLPVCIDDRATVYETEGPFTIYHLALENDDYYTNYGIYANGLLVETCSKRYLKELSNMSLIE